MTERKPRYPAEVFARRGTEIYQEKIRPLVEAGNKSKYVAIDIETGEFEMDKESLQASLRLLARLPDAQIWGIRVGYPTERTFGGSSFKRIEQDD
jgi:hypothetical protein